MTKPSENQPLLRFWKQWLSKQKAVLLGAAFFMILVAAAVAAQQKLVGTIVDALSVLFSNPDKIIAFGLSAKELTFYGPIIIVIVSIMRGVGWYISNYLTNLAAMNATNELQTDFFAKILTLDYIRITKEQSGAFSARFLNDINSIREAVLKVANSFVRELFTLIFVLFVMFDADWQLALVTSLLLPLAWLPVNSIGKKIRKSANLAQEQASLLSGVIEESLGGIRLVKTYSLEKSENERVGNALEKRKHLLLKMIEQRGRLLPVLEILGGIVVAAVIGFAAYRIANGQSTVGNLMTFITSLLAASASLRTFGDMNNQLQEGVSGLNRFFEIFDEEPKIKNIDNPIEIKKCDGTIEFKNVHFSIGEAKILSGIDFTAKKGQIIAFVGASGAGKSSIINLVPRLFDIETGEINIDGIDIKQLEISDLRRQIALVSQDAILFENTIAANVCFGAGVKTKTEIENALKKAACDFVFENPEGIDAMVAPKGGNFSGGQRQRLALARAILRDAPILLLDEPTSALDSDNEAKIQEFLDEFCKTKTTLVVAHRLSTIDHASEINVMADGKIIERGTHSQLMENDGPYAQLARLQNT